MLSEEALISLKAAPAKLPSLTNYQDDERVWQQLPISRAVTTASRDEKDIVCLLIQSHCACARGCRDIVQHTVVIR